MSLLTAMITRKTLALPRERSLLLSALLVSFFLLVTVYVFENTGRNASPEPARAIQPALEDDIDEYQDQTDGFAGNLARRNFCEPVKQGAVAVPDDQKIAVLVERRDAPDLIPILSHFMGILPEWKFHVFHSTQNAERFKTSAVMRRRLRAGKLKLTRIPDRFPLANHPDVSRFLTDTWLWRQIQEEHILLFQLDSMICSQSDLDINDYLHYDFVGGPANANGHLVYNGGLSLRRRSKLLKVLAQHDVRNLTWANDWEDQWFSRNLAAMPDNCLPSPKAAAEFSIDALWYGHSIGAHQVWRWHNPQRLALFEAKCPEVHIILKRKHLFNNGHPGWDGGI